ncbi:hypothetical protein [Sphaerisporangium fuscum]|uniref:hypothetical protein n=1 Tax=Sphaerisporangium fuscum TaxID=2835868 RepID=UPI001BDDAB06|nr:hypothetical protein [Sphaerisporangium fuscum]
MRPDIHPAKPGVRPRRHVTGSLEASSGDDVTAEEIVITGGELADMTGGHQTDRGGETGTSGESANGTYGGGAPPAGGGEPGRPAPAPGDLPFTGADRAALLLTACGGTAAVLLGALLLYLARRRRRDTDL